MKTIREALEAILFEIGDYTTEGLNVLWCGIKGETIRKAKKALSESEAEWLPDYDYEYAQCSNCGHMQYTGWDSHAEQAEEIGDFHKEYKYCPNCGAKMKGREEEYD